MFLLYAFYNQINKDIENGKIINWQQFKRLKGHKTGQIKFDSLDMENFETFFSELYDNKHKTLSAIAKDDLLVVWNTLGPFL